MKKALAEVDMLKLISELQTRQAAMEARLEKLDPTPKLQTLQPYRIDVDEVFSIIDLEARYPLLVRGYPRPGFISVTVLAGEPERELPLQSVRPREKCPRAETTPTEAFEHLADPTAREFFEGRQKAQIAARTTTLPLPPLPKQRRWFGAQDEIPTWGMSVGTGNEQ